MKRVALTAETREAGKGVSKKLRSDGQIPAVLYGRSIEPVSIVVNRKEVEAAVKGSQGTNILIDLSIKGGESGLARIRDYQADPFKREFLHLDFQAISITDKIEVEVPIEITGKSVGVKEGGVLEQMRRTLLVKALPDRIPASIALDITDLNIGDSVHADEIKLPEGVEYPSKMNYAVVAVVPPTKVEEVAAVTAAAPVEGAAAAPAEGAAAAAPAAAPAKEGTAEAKKE
ncbi:MAG TPA: 50S ribosomal protein L25 [bacterium]|nr:50S ribosomal protein L25 [Myxococcales bacterium]OQA59339.1 MAG: 50S ribosomal protein L25 [bacterium ADurb.Bin270]HPW44755.1 50S ribosomal protein L25 [bacterium]HQH79940.1 50S ribosomal protein L25 [bacterium]